MSARQRVLPGYVAPTTCDVAAYLQRWMIDIADAVGVDPEPWQLQVTEEVDERGITTALELPELVGPASGPRVQLDASVYPDGTTRLFRVDVIVPPGRRVWGWHADDMHHGFTHEHDPGVAQPTELADLDQIRTELIARFQER